MPSVILISASLNCFWKSKWVGEPDLDVPDVIVISAGLDVIAHEEAYQPVFGHFDRILGEFKKISLYEFC